MVECGGEIKSLRKPAGNCGASGRRRSRGLGEGYFYRCMITPKDRGVRRSMGILKALIAQVSSCLRARIQELCMAPHHRRPSNGP